jgi:hypothetical protein
MLNIKESHSIQLELVLSIASLIFFNIPKPGY